MYELLVRIDAPLFCAGLECQFIDGEYVAVNSAPVIKDMVGWDIDRILNFCRARRWGTCVSNVDWPCDDSHRSQ
ncbi:MAG: hypothetical protein QF785_11685 [Phycisphaeraceae bacterium]|nr:hypothetical protein [Phycisphaeraceae bacterium]